MIKGVTVLMLCTILTISLASAHSAAYHTTTVQKPATTPETRIIDNGAIDHSQHSSNQAIATKAFVEKAAAYVRIHGRIKAACQFNQAEGPFHHGNRYIFAFVCHDGDNNGFFVASPSAPQHTFQQRLMSPLFAGIMAAVKHEPNGIWYHYCWYDPETGNFEQKRSYM
ncbi:MAG: hypothetical protein GY821_13385 [Gammaproteobacteria bacterium]|nr:hypothetical protein [Gammaproteobacteria bacterium]